MSYLYKLTVVLFLVLLLKPAFAQDSHTTNTDRPWYYPDHAVVQFAGNIGVLAAGPGYSYLRDKVTTELLYGYVPAFDGENSIHIITAKTTYHPFNIKLSENYMLEPFKIGTGFSYSAGPQFETWWPTRYPSEYYWWASSLRFTPYIGATISRRVGSENTLIKRVELSPEIGTHDLSFVSFINNKDFSAWKILNLAIGTKFVF